jgi:putative transcriptional regulator
MNIKDMRTRAGMTQAQFAELLGVPKRTLENWEYGKSRCPEWAIKLINYYLSHEGLYKTKEV